MDRPFKNLLIKQATQKKKKNLYNQPSHFGFSIHLFLFSCGDSVYLVVSFFSKTL
jgi:hypothetical protein